MARSQKPAQAPEATPPQTPEGQEERRWVSVRCAVHMNGQRFARGAQIAVSKAEFDTLRAAKALKDDALWEDPPISPGPEQT